MALYPILLKEVGDVELWLVDVHFLLAIVVKVVIAFNFFSMLLS